jgi:transposase
MRYQQSIAIHERIEEVRRLIETGEYSTPALAEKVGVSIPTISRILAALRELGHDIRSEKRADGWAYRLHARQAKVSSRKGSLRK